MIRWAMVLPLTAAVLTACGGGSSVSSLPHAAAAVGPGASLTPGTTAPVVVAIQIPRSVAPAGLRRAAYVSQYTQSAAIAVGNAAPVVADLSATSPNCTATAGGGRTCTIAVAAPVGVDAFAETLYAGPSATGSILSQGKTTATIAAGAANTVVLTLGGVIARLSLQLAAPTVATGTAAQVGLTVNFYDAGGASIIGSDPFVTPVTLSDSDTAGATTVSKTTLTSPADAAALTVNYSGAATFTQAVLGASTGSVAAATVTLAAASAPPSTAAFNDYATFGYDNRRDVFNPNSTSITPASMTNFHLAWQSTLGNGDYNTQSQPILAANVGGHAGVLVVGGGSGRVYGFDALTGTPLWQYATGQETYTCEGGDTFVFGVGGTAAYDSGSHSLYVVGNSNTGANTAAANTLFHLDAATGALLGQVNFAPATPGWPSLDFSHTSVTLGTNGLAYVGTGATCDISSWRGRVAAVSVPSMTLAGTFFTVWDPQNTRGGGAQPWGGGGVWGWGGVSIDFAGNVITGVGNTDNGLTTHDGIFPPFVQAPQEYSGLGEAVIKLSPDLSTLEDQHHPIPTTSYAGVSTDLDVNGTPTIFQPNGTGCVPLAALQSKSGSLYVYDETNIGRGLLAQYQLAPSTYADGFLGGPAFSAATGYLYANVTSSSSSLFPPGMIAIDPGCGHPTVAWHTPFGPDSYPSGIPRSVPAVSAGGVVFVGTLCTPDGNGGCSGSTATAAKSRNIQSAVRKPSICCAPSAPGDGALWAIDASTGTVLNGGEPLIYTSGPLRAPPTIDGNWIFVLDNNGVMYGFTIDPSVPQIASRARALDSRTLRNWEPAPH